MSLACPTMQTAQATAESAERSLKASAGQPTHAPGATNASRNMHAKFAKLGYSLPIEIECTEHVCTSEDVQTLQNFTTYHVKPRSWIRHWMTHAPELLGGCSGPASDNFEAFWRTYEVQHPNHVVFETHSHQLEKVVPLLLHGDEGRTVKRTNYLVMSMESPLGSVNDPNIRCACSEEMAGRKDLPSYGNDLGTLSPKTLEIARKQLTNYKGHSYLSKWLLFGVGGWIYKKQPHIMDELLQIATADLQQLFYNGVELSNGERVFGAVIGVKGDMAFHKQTMRLLRSYYNCGQKVNIPLCHHCLAGNDQYKFEDFGEDPSWVASMYMERPWPVENPPPLSNIPYDNTCPEQALQGDIFHIHKLGVARDVIGGVLIILLRLGFMDHEGSTKNMTDRFTRAHSYFAMWCSSNGKTPGLRSFSKAYFNLKTLVSAPWVNAKGSDSTLLLEWLDFTLRLNLQHPSVEGHTQLLRHMLQLVESSLAVRMVHTHRLWLERDCARRLYVKLMTVLRAYSVMAQSAMRLKIRAFVLKPKHHSLHHIAWFLKTELRKGAALIYNPQGYACEMNEDFVGRISRLSRRVGFRLCDKRVFERVFLKVTALLRRRKELRQSRSRSSRVKGKFRK